MITSLNFFKFPQSNKAMNDYRPLTSEEIEVLKQNSCWAEDWTSINVSEDFKPNFMHRVMLYGEVNIGAFNKNVEVSQGFVKHSGINNATLRNVTIGDDCLIENIGNFINNYTIGDDCYISNLSTMETTEGATYGEGNLVSVLNEVGEGNVILFSDLNSQLAAFMVKHFSDRELKEKIRQLIKTDIDNKAPELRDRRLLRNKRSFPPQRLHPAGQHPWQRLCRHRGHRRELNYR